MSISHIVSIVIAIFGGSWIAYLKSELSKLKSEAKSVVSKIETGAKADLAKLKSYL